jgi:hypothetical protein
MAELFGGVGMLLNIVTALFFYVVMAALFLMVRKTSKDVADLKRLIADLQETITLQNLPKEARGRDRL